MKSLLRIAAAALLAVTFTGCSLNELAKVEPADWERKQFEQRVSRSLARAASAPGIDNGSTIIVTSEGDTLLAPADSTLASSQVRTVYVDVHTTYPHTISGRVLDMVGIFSAIGVIAAMVLLILLGVFVVVIRRQHGRNKLISRAIAEGYQLPESFFTGMPASPQVTVVNEAVRETVRETVRESHESQDEPSDSRQCDTVPPVPPIPPIPDPRYIKKVAGTPATPRVKELSRAFILLGLGIVIFLAFAAGHNAEVGLFIGGILAVFGGAKLLTLYLSNRL